MDAINYTKTHSNRAAAKRFHVDERKIRQRKQKHEELAVTQTKKGRLFKKRLEVGRRKLTDKELEEKVINWIYERRENILRISRKLSIKGKNFK